MAAGEGRGLAGIEDIGSAVAISVCVPARNEAAVIGPVLDQILSTAPPEVSEVLVCLNGCSDETESVVRKRAGDPRLAILHSPPGKPSAWTALYKRARGPVLCFIDADVVPDADAMRQLALALRDHPRICIAAGCECPTSNGSLPRLLVWAQIPLGQDYLSGRLYAVHRERLEARLRQAGIERAEIPEDLIAEDQWLQAVAEPDGWLVVPSARVRFRAGRVADYLKRVARHRVALEQIGARDPRLLAALAPRLPRGVAALALLRRRLAAPGVSPHGRAAGSVGFLVRLAIRIAFRRRIALECRAMRALVASGRGSQVLAGPGRTGER